MRRRCCHRIGSETPKSQSGVLPSDETVKDLRLRQPSFLFLGCREANLADQWLTGDALKDSVRSLVRHNERFRSEKEGLLESILTRHHGVSYSVG
jgi:hypothetical protein